MKKNFTFGAFGLLLSANLFAQPVISTSDFYPSVGETYTVYSSGYMDPGASGNNVTWDFSSMSNTSSLVTNVQSPNSNFPGTDVTLSSSSSNSYIDMAADGWYTHGMSAQGVTFTYQDPMKMNLFPMSMNATYTDYFHATFTSGVDFERFGNMNGTVDGYGTLITPEGTFNDVLRVHYIQDYQDSSEFFVYTYYVEAYGWYKAGFHSELASISTLTSNLGSGQYGFYLETSGLGLTQEEMESVQVFPNPVHDKLTVNTGNADLFKSLELTDLNGKVYDLDYTQENEILKLNLEKLSTGIYFLTLSYSDGTAVNKKIAIE